MKISNNFSRSEFACKCGCSFDTVDVILLDVLQNLRDYFGKRVTILSGCRCSQHNKLVGGSKNSQHLTGKASDITVQDIEPQDVYKYVDDCYPNMLGIGLYTTMKFVHIDSREVKARWWS